MPLPGNIATILSVGSLKNNSSTLPDWNGVEKFLFRFFFIYFLILVIPHKLEFYQSIRLKPLGKLHFKHLLDMVKYTQFDSVRELFILFTVALVGSIVWTIVDYQKKEYRNKLYFLRVLLRYKLASVLITFGIYKFYCLQMPFPSLSNLHTNYGDYSDWKIYFQTLGITPEYQSLIGLFEILAGILLLFPRTTLLGAGMALGFLANIVVVNFLYHSGDEFFSFYVFQISLFLLSYDAPRIWNLLILQKNTTAEKFNYTYEDVKTKWLRVFIKLSFVLFLILVTYTGYASSRDPYKIPFGKGLPFSKGYYNVKTFIINSDTIPYSLTNPLRWQNVIFEQWPTISIASSRELKVEPGDGDTLSEDNLARKYELVGLAGRSYFNYTFDSLQHTLKMQNKNRNYSKETFIFQYQQQGDSVLLMHGTNEANDRLFVVLEKREKKYLLHEGLRKPVKL